MPFVPAPDCVEVDFQAALDSQQIVNVLWFRFLSGAPGTGDLGALALALNPSWVTNIVDKLVSQ